MAPRQSGFVKSGDYEVYIGKISNIYI